MIVDALAGTGPWGWIVLGVLLIGIELLAPGVFFLWLGLAAMATGLLSAMFAFSWQVSALVFAVLAVLAVIVGRTLARPGAQADSRAESLNRRGEGLVGRVFVLETPIAEGVGRVRVDDSSWRVKGPERPVGTRMRVIGVEGTTLIVEDA